MAGASGSAGMRRGVATPSSRARPACTCGSVSTVLENTMSISPA